MSAHETLTFTRKQGDKALARIELLRGVDESEILHVETAPAHRRQGLAQSLLIEALNWARSNQRMTVWLEVRTSNVPAIALYAKMGFVTSRTRRQYYADGEDALVMKCSL